MKTRMPPVKKKKKKKKNIIASSGGICGFASSRIKQEWFPSNVPIDHFNWLLECYTCGDLPTWWKKKKKKKLPQVHAFDLIIEPWLFYYSGIFYFCQYLHIGAGILSFGGDVFRL